MLHIIIQRWTSIARCCLALILLAVPALVSGQPSADTAATEEGQSLLDKAKEHMELFEMRLANSGDAVELYPRPLLTYGDSARANKNGTVWAFGATGRPLAILELYQGVEAGARWVHAISLTGKHTVTMKTPLADSWAPAATQIEPVAFEGVEAPLDREQRRTRQLKDLARRFSAHEFWDPENSRFELRLLAQPVLRYQNSEAGVQDGAVFILAHGTNPEVIVLIEAIGPNIDAARWHYSLARLGSAELHVELDGKEVWKQGRTPGVVGRSTDPYWLFLTPGGLPAEKK